MCISYNLTNRTSRSRFAARLTVISAGTTGLEVQVHIEINGVISFGLEVFASIFGFIAIALEVSMKNSIAIFTSVMACVWCGIAFLRSLW